LAAAMRGGRRLLLPGSPERGRPEEGDATPPWGNPEAEEGWRQI